MVGQDGVVVGHDAAVDGDDLEHGTIEDVLPGSLLGPIVGLSFSTDGGFLFACVGSSLRVYDVPSGMLLSNVRVFTPGVAVYGLDIGKESFGAIFGDRCVRIVDSIPTRADATSLSARSAGKHVPCDGAKEPSATDADGRRGCVSSARNAVDSANLTTAGKNSDNCQRVSGNDFSGSRQCWFRGLVRLPELDDRVWDARLIGEGFSDAGNVGCTLNTVEHGRVRIEEETGWRERGIRGGIGLVAVALAHNSVEVWNWTAQHCPLRVSRTRGGDPCLLYHASLWGRTLGELWVACGTVFNQVLVWHPGQSDAATTREKRGKGDAAGPEDPEVRDVLRLKAHEGVIFRVAWREDGKRLASVSDDRTVRVWGVEHGCSSFPAGKYGCADTGGEGRSGGDKIRGTGGRLIWTGWGHSSRIWDVGFTRVGVVTCGEDGAAILWSERPSHKIFSKSGLATEASSAAGLPVDGQHGRYMVPAAIMRGHSGSHVWRLNVHDFTPDSTDAKHEGSDNVCAGRDGGVSAAKKKRRAMVLMATGGNDGALKIWDLRFEAACERRPPWQSRDGTFWGETVPLTFPCLSSASPLPQTVTAETTLMAKSHEEGTPQLAGESALQADGNLMRIRTSTAVELPPGAAEQIKTNNPSLQLSQLKIGEARQREQHPDRSARRKHDRLRQRPAVVREVRLSQDLLGAAVLFADGSVWWVGDLGVGTWWPVTALPLNAVPPVSWHVVAGGEASRGRVYGDAMSPSKTPQLSVTDEDRAAASDRVTPEGFLPSTAVSAIAVVRLRHGAANRDLGSDGADGCTGKGSYGRGKDERPAGVSGCSDKVAIVAGCDDGWLFLLTQNRHQSGVGAHCHEIPGSSNEQGEEVMLPLGPWYVSAAWKGHRARVTAMWVLCGGAKSTCARGKTSDGDSRSFTAALDTSRLPLPSKGWHRVGVEGTLVSAAADGTVAWWEWGSAEQMKSVGYDFKDGHAQRGGNIDVTLPSVRMVCQAGAAFAITSVTIDDRTRLHASLGAVVFCGDTKGNISCFLERGPAESFLSEDFAVDGERQEVRRGGEKRAAVESISPCLVLKRQHGKDQISRIALQGDCLFSAGHDGKVNHYVISYQHPSEQLATDELRLPVGTSGHMPWCRTTTASLSAPADAFPWAKESSPDADASERKCEWSARQDLERFPYSLPSKPVLLTLATCYATAPITAVSDLWVAGGEDGVAENGGRREGLWLPGMGEEKVRVAVAGRSGSSRMSVWDLTEGRQLLELACGEQHLAQDLLLSWPLMSQAPGSSTTVFHERGTTLERPSIFPYSRDNNVDAALELSRGFGARCGEPVAPLLPRHTFVFVRPASKTKGAASNNAIGRSDESIEEVCSRAEDCAARNDHAALVRELRQRPDLALAFHSTVVGAVPETGDCQRPTPEPRQQRQCMQSPQPDLLPGLPQGDEVRVAAGHEAADAESSRISCVPTHGVHAGNTTCNSRRAGGSSTSEGTTWQRIDSATGVLPRRFGYSLGEPFHGHRVTSVRFIPGDAAIKEGDSYSDLRLVTGGEDGAVKLLDVFYKRRLNADRITTDIRSVSGRRAGSGDFETHHPSAPCSNGPDRGQDTHRPRRVFHCPYVAVAQTLPSHESSVGALAVGSFGESFHLGVDAQAVFFSGGGKMEVRAWCLEDWRGNGVDRNGIREAGEATCAPPVRWLLTTTPAPKSPLHAHRIMALCVLPPLPTRPTLDAKAHIQSHGTIFVTGDSGGGVTIFELRRDNDTGEGAEREARSRPAGRWMASGERPVLCLGHARVIVPNGVDRTRVMVPHDSDRVCARCVGGEEGTVDINDPKVAVLESFHHKKEAEGNSDDEPGVPKDCPLREDARGVAPEGRWDAGHANTRQRARRADGRERSEQVVGDFILTGDTGGTVTVWEFLPGVAVSSSKRPDPPQVAEVEGGFVHRGPAGRRRGGKAAAEAPPLPGLVPVLQYRAHQTGVLCMAVHTLASGGRFLIVSGGDDQAICVAEVEVLHGHSPELSDAERSPQSSPTDYVERNENKPSRNRRLSARLVGGAPQITTGAAGSAIKGIGVLCPVFTRLRPLETAFRNADEIATSALGSTAANSHRPPPVLSVFTISRDQRLSRWKLVESTTLPTTPRTSQGMKRKPTSGGADSGRVHPNPLARATRHEVDSSRRGNSGTPRSGDVAVDSWTASSSQDGGEAQQGGQKEREQTGRWRLLWRAGCVMDVCDVSDLDVVALPSDPTFTVGHSTGYRDPEDSLHGRYRLFSPSITLEESRNGKFCERGVVDADRGARKVDRSSRTGLVSPAALVAVSGQGLQLVLFGAD